MKSAPRPACRLMALLGIGASALATPALADCPEFVGSVDTPGYARGVAVSGDFAHVADEAEGLRVIDVSSPSTPVEVGFADTPGNARGVEVSGGYAYVADGNSGLRVIDVSTPSTPVEVLIVLQYRPWPGA